MKIIEKDILIIGTGIAGISLALKLNEKFNIAILTKTNIEESNTYYAQGGIAASFDKFDSYKFHVEDTLVAGAGLCDERVVEKVAFSAPSLIKDLVSWGVNFTKFENNYDLTKEGGHSKRRIFHKEDYTGREIETNLVKNLKTKKNIEIFEKYTAINLITEKEKGKSFCIGIYALNNLTGEIFAINSRYTVLATGGAGKVYLYTSNPDISSGDGIAMAYRVGANISNMEFMQFHPTCLYHKDAKSFLITESLRGEGAKLKLPNGEEFMQKYHELKELAPRDVVARAIDFEIKKYGITNVFLDIRHKPSDYLINRFPNVYKNCLKFGIDITKDMIPVVPASHYTCGGIKVNIDGMTNINNLFAIGEVSCTGLHGANRLASNSLLEAIFFADRVAKFLNKNFEYKKHPFINDWDSKDASDSDEAILIHQNWEEIRRFMWNYVGIVRSNKRLMRAKRRIEILKKEVQEYYWNFKITMPLLELRNLVTVSEIIVNSALKRKESRGLHYTLDYPDTLDVAKDTIVRKRLK